MSNLVQTALKILTEAEAERKGKTVAQLVEKLVCRH